MRNSILIWFVVAFQNATAQGQNTSATLPTIGPEEPCQNITDVPICEDMPWRTTFLPNAFGHTSQIEANQELEQFRRLIQSNCSGAIVIFLCSAYFPYCTENHPLRVLQPCRRVCQHVRDGCEPVFNERAGGLPWPDHLNCDNYEDNDQCFGPSPLDLEEVTIPPNLLRPTTPTIPPDLTTNTTPITTSIPSLTQPTTVPEECEPITDMPICKDMPWNYTAFPNIRGHTSQTEANQELEQFRQLIEVNCSGAIVIFLCSIYAPFCTDNHPLRVLRPCRRLCQHVRNGCEPVFNERAGGLPWPDHLNCDNYEDNDQCFGPSPLDLEEITIPPNLLRPTTPTIPPDLTTNTTPITTSIPSLTQPTTVPEECEPITDMPICEDMPWNYTAFPNFRGHTSQAEANQELEQFRQLIEVNCSGAIVIFLCSIYAPFCTDNHPLRVLRPCRRLCQHVRNGCEPVFNERAGGLPWPDHLNCDNYEDNNQCFGPSPLDLEEVTIPPNLLRPITPTIPPDLTTNVPITTSTPSLTQPTTVPEECEPITDMPICEDMPWNYTAFPNFRGHTSQAEANQELEQFRQLIEVNCSGAIVIFLCSIYAPFCTDNHPLRVLRPCRRLCQHVRNGCEPVFNERAGGLPWPDHLNCDNYEDNDQCFGPSPLDLEEITIPPNLLRPTTPTIPPDLTTNTTPITTSIPSLTQPTTVPEECEAITDMPICEDMPWNYTAFPNIRGHTSQTEANQELEQFRQLIEVNCSGAIVIFLCSIYAPFCTDNHPLRVLRPCRRLCQHVRNGCEPVFNEWAGGLPWPDHLNCDDYEDNNQCFGPSQLDLEEVTIPPNLVRPTTSTIPPDLTTNTPITTYPPSLTQPTTVPEECEPITDMPICKNMPWNYTAFPNIRDHFSQTEANQELEQFRQLIETKCSGATATFLCSIYAPFCLETRPLSKIRPCKRLCLHVRDGCEAIFNRLTGGLPWPDHLNCDNYENNLLCIDLSAVPSDPTSSTSPTVSTSTPNTLPTSNKSSSLTTIDHSRGLLLLLILSFSFAF